MPVKLDLNFSKSAPKGDFVTICLIGEDGALLPHLDGAVAAHLIGAMSTAQFKGKVGKSLTLYTDTSCYLLLGVGKMLLGWPARRKTGKRLVRRFGENCRKARLVARSRARCTNPC